MKYVDEVITYAEVPDEVSLCLSISGCTNHCPGCHSQYLWNDLGTELDEHSLKSMLSKYDELTCVCFMGGDQYPEELNHLLNIVKDTGLKTALYTGKKELSKNVDETLLDYVKIGPYIESLGPLDSPTTNQVLYRNKDGKRFDFISRIWVNFD